VKKNIQVERWLFPRAILGEIYLPQGAVSYQRYPFDTLRELLGPTIDYKDEGYAIDKKYPAIIFIPDTAQINIQQQLISWELDGHTHSIKLLINHFYVYPNGFRVHMERHPNAPSWRLVGTHPEGTFCHKPSTVSGGGKSEISKSIAGAIISGAIFVDNFDKDMDMVVDIFEHDYSCRFRDSARNGSDLRRLLSNKRTLGSVIKLLTPSITEYSDEYNQWLKQVPQHIWAMVLMIKRFYKAEWGQNWREHFPSIW